MIIFIKGAVEVKHEIQSIILILNCHKDRVVP